MFAALTMSEAQSQHRIAAVDTKHTDLPEASFPSYFSQLFGTCPHALAYQRT